MSRVFDVYGTFHLTCNSGDVITLIVSDDCKLQLELNNGEFKVLIFNNANKELTIDETWEITNSNVEVNYLDFNNYNFNQKNNMVLHKDSSLVVNSTYLGCNEKKIDFNLVNKESDTSIKISNNVVCLDEADFCLNVVGKIENGAKRAKCYQKSRCLTFDNPKNAKILPVLLIDENDVEASHSLSSGTIDEDVLFYMNSRGLSKKDALSLLLVSYLMPSEDFYKEFENGIMIKEIADKKVENICSR